METVFSYTGGKFIVERVDPNGFFTRRQVATDSFADSFVECLLEHMSPRATQALLRECANKLDVLIS